MLKKSMLAAGAVAVSLVALQPAPASAGNVDLHFSFGGWHGGHGGWHVGHGGWGHYDRLTCREARRSLRRHYGFRRIRAIECNGRRYTFRARRGGKLWRIKVNAYTGEVVRMRRI